MRPKFLLSVLPVTCFLIAAAAATALARDATVILQDGRQLTGQVVTETETNITLRISGIDTPIAKDQLRDIKYMATIEEEYQQRRGALQDTDLEGRYRLAQWLYESWNRDRGDKALELALQELSSLGSAFPDEQRVAQLRTIVESRIKLREEEIARAKVAQTQAQAQAQPQQPAAPAQPEQAAGKAVVLPTKMLSDEEINRIKVWEIDLDARPNVSVPRDVREEILKNFAAEEDVPKGRTQQRQFLAAPGYEVLDLLFKIRARGYYDKAIVMDDPPAMQTFRKSIHQRYVLNYCGTVQCHGGPEAGSLFVFRASPNSPQTVYTNFYILHASGDGRMVKRSSPKESLLVEYGLPRNEARFPHPEVAGWRAALRGTSDPEYESLIAWIASLIEGPDYGISYEVPKLPKRAAPATPAAAPAPTPPPSPAPAPAPQPTSTP